MSSDRERHTVLITDDDSDYRERLVGMLGSPECCTEQAADLDAALQIVSGGTIDVVLAGRCGQSAGTADGQDLTEAVRSVDPSTSVVLLTDHDDAAWALAHIRAGAADCLPRSVSTADLAGAVARAAARSRVLKDAERHRNELARYRTQCTVLSSQLAAILVSALDPIVTINDRGIVQSASRSVERVFGWKPEELIGRNISILMPEPYRSEHDGYIRSYVDRGDSHVLGLVREFEAVRKDGFTFPCEINVWRVDVPEHVKPMFTGIIRDVTERQWREEELTKALTDARAAIYSKSEFLANMSHEIRTPMTAIQGFAEALLDPDHSAREREDAARTIHRNAKHLLQILDDILDLSKIEAGRLDVERIACSPFALVRDVVSLMRVRADDKRLPLEIEFAGPIPQVVQTDPTRLRQILLNLIGNAIKFTECGEVRLVVGRPDDDAPKPSMLQFDVIDTGIGMTAEQVAHLFKPFVQADTSTTRNYGGSGLGLAISIRLAEMLGGDIRVTSEPGEGSRFSLLIDAGSLDGVPLVEEAAEADLPVESGWPAPRRISGALRGRVLLAEDGPDNRRLICFILQKAGAEVTLAANGQEAVEAVRRAENANRPFDLILMDMQMPVLDGYQATRMLRREGCHCPVVALTAHAMLDDREKCLLAGCDDYVSKPVDRRQLVELLGSHLGAARIGNTARS